MSFARHEDRPVDIGLTQRAVVERLGPEPDGALHVAHAPHDGTDPDHADSIRLVRPIRQRAEVYRVPMAGYLIGFIWLVIVVGGALALGAIVQLVKAPYRKR
ncbi:hypothetical protein GCM10009617_01100 [Leifsonia poae]|uniref:Uncharacterized protein n=1 Tax=Leifsonia poae TaxID=110933 RepID=A0A9W6H6W3_9MICO|nr:hypothetical protein GCM10017584_01110 [Leifsonia poae]